MSPFRQVALLLALSMAISGCASPPHHAGPYSSPAEADRNPLRAQELTMRAAELLYDDPDAAEAMLREALTADIYHGPAHNNLGVLHLSKGALYEAANEFEWARKLMPGHPDPRINLALVLERAGRIDDAIGRYRTVLETHPEHVPAMQGITRLQIRYGREDEQTPRLLDEIALRGETSSWRNWARERLLD